WGSPTDLPWGVVFGGSAGTMPRHPSPLYEAILEGILLFTILIILSRKRPPRPRGTFIGIFLIAYALFRFLIEFIREPDAHLGYLWGGWVTMGQLLSLPMLLLGVGILIFAFVKKLPQLGLPFVEEEGEGQAQAEGTEQEIETKEDAQAASEPKQSGVEPQDDEGSGEGTEAIDPDSSPKS
ncbi:MAG: prolipoprotein diacylglyceryl transferase, partial [Eggerthellaceae bacterium]|nr:prolipoprotein diacylglyceryl transferase [Eggerthellaceae bacterium]